MTLTQERDNLARQYADWLGPIPDPVPLEMRVLSKRFICASYVKDYEEWKVEYAVEGPGTMPEPSGRTVPAYLLIPKHKDQKPPFPAMICYHQCGIDCAMGKDSVVGRFPERPDQAYGYELVQQGFVVLAPEAMCCGERQMPWLQPPGAYGPNVRHECWWMAQQFEIGPVRDRFGRSWQNKIVTDGLRAVDLLQSLDFVDPHRIGVVGHSLGGHVALATMAYDTRVKAGIVSGSIGSKGIRKPQLAAVAPRLLMRLHGTYDKVEPGLSPKETHDFVRPFYEDAGVPQNLVLRTPPCGHVFLDDFKREAYTRLKHHFGIGVKTEPLLFEDTLPEAQIDRIADIDSGPSGKHRVIANRESLAYAVRLLCAACNAKLPPGQKPKGHVEASGEHVKFIVTVPKEHTHVETPTDHLIRRVRDLLFEISASYTAEPLPHATAHIITLLRDA